MLSNKHHGSAAAAILGSVALLGTSAVNAVIDVDVDEPMKSYYAKEALTEDAEVEDTGYYAVDNDGTDNNLHIQVRMDYVATGQESIYVRIDIPGLQFHVDVEASTFQTDNGDTIADVDVVHQGAAGDDSVILGVPASANVAQKRRSSAQAPVDSRDAGEHRKCRSRPLRYGSRCAIEVQCPEDWKGRWRCAGCVRPFG